MKKYLLLALTLLATSVYSQTIIMEESGGVYKIPCLVNGAKMKMIFDTGASKVSLSMTMADYLYENDYITDEDILGTGQSSVADGSIVNHVIINLRDIEIAGLHLTNVQAVVIEGQNAPLLLGQSAIQQLGKITLEGNRLIIENGSVGTEQHFDIHMQQMQKHWRLLDTAYDLYNKELYKQACDYFNDAAKISDLNAYALETFVFCCLQSRNDYYKKYAIECAKEIKITDYDTLIADGINIYSTIALAYYLNRQYNDAAAYYKLAFETPIKGETQSQKIHLSSMIAESYYLGNDAYQAKKYYSSTLNLVAKYYNVEVNYIFRDALGELSSNEQSYRKRDRDIDIDRYIYDFIWCENQLGKISKNEYWYKICKLAQNNNEYAQDLIIQMNYCCNCD